MARACKWLTLLFCCLMAAGLAAQHSQEFDALAMNRRGAKGNTVLLVYPGTGLRRVDPVSGEVVANLRVTVTVRRAGNAAVVLEMVREEKIRQGFGGEEDPFLLEYPMDLPAGRYQMEVEVRDKASGATFLTLLGHEVRDLGQVPNLSDLALAQGFTGAEVPLQPLLGTQLVPFPEAQLHFGGDVHALPGSTLTLRAVLYRQTAVEPGEPASYDYHHVESFSSVQQYNDILKVGMAGTVAFSRSLPLDPLEEGDYLLEVSLYANEVRVAEAGRIFTIPWKGLREVFSRLEEAIDRMEYVAPPEVIASLKAEANPGLRQERFLRFWSQRAGSEEAGIAALRQYYERIMLADHLFPEGEVPGWKTDRGRVLCLYGPPDRKEQITHEGKPVEVWSYLPRNLRMVFFVEGETYHWVKPYHD